VEGNSLERRESEAAALCSIMQQSHKDMNPLRTMAVCEGDVLCQVMF